MKLILQPITVQSTDTTLSRITWDKKQYQILSIEDTWISQTNWWSKEDKRIYYRVRTDRAVLEIYSTGTQWMLSRIFD